MTVEDKYKNLKNTHQQLLDDWKQNNKPCIICGINTANEKDHLPPKVLYPKRLRDSKTEFFTFPVCSTCNRGSSDADYLFSVLISLSLNQSFYLKGINPTDPDLIALHEQMEKQLKNPKEGKRRQDLLTPFLDEDPITGKPVININKLPVNETITKIVKSIYWLNSNGDILQKKNPGWWIRPDIDTTKESFIKHHLMKTEHELQWDNRFITRYTIGLPSNGVGGLISCSLHFYTEMQLGYGNNWLIIASPQKTKIKKKSLYDISVSTIWRAYNLSKG